MNFQPLPRGLELLGFATACHRLRTNRILGPNIVAFSLEDPGAGARVFKDFAKENEDFEIKALSVGGKLLPANQIDALAKLPTRDQALAMLVGVMQAPITKLVRTFNDVPAKVTRDVAAVRDQKQDAAA